MEAICLDALAVILRGAFAVLTGATGRLAVEV